MNEDFNNLVFYAICESLYLQKDTTNYVSFGGLCQNMHDVTIYDLDMGSDIKKVLNKTMSDIMILYGFTPEEMGDFIILFLKGRKWEEYVEFVRTLRKHTRNSFQ